MIPDMLLFLSDWLGFTGSKPARAGVYQKIYRSMNAPISPTLYTERYIRYSIRIIKHTPSCSVPSAQSISTSSGKALDQHHSNIFILVFYVIVCPPSSLLLLNQWVGILRQPDVVDVLNKNMKNLIWSGLKSNRVFAYNWVHDSG